MGAHGEVTWATGLNHGGATLLIALLSGDETSVALRILTARRADKAVDRSRAINRSARNCSSISPLWRGPLTTAGPKRRRCS